MKKNNKSVFSIESCIIDKHWIRESEDRINAYDQGKLKTISVKDVFKKIDK